MPLDASPLPRPARTIRPPKGYEDHLTRKQAAAVLGFASEFKVRQLEKEGRLRSVRGNMGTAFYAKADLLTLRAQLSASSAPAGASREWSDAELLELLLLPLAGGTRRTALDLVLQTGISISRAEGIVAFHAQYAASPPPSPSTATPNPIPAADGPATPAKGADPAERRNPSRLTRDELIQSLRHPDPGVREQAFQALRRTP